MSLKHQEYHFFNLIPRSRVEEAEGKIWSEILFIHWNLFLLLGSRGNHSYSFHEQGFPCQVLHLRGKQ